MHGISVFRNKIEIGNGKFCQINQLVHSVETDTPSTMITRNIQNNLFYDELNMVWHAAQTPT